MFTTANRAEQLAQIRRLASVLLVASYALIAGIANAQSTCQTVMLNHPELTISDEAREAMAKAGLGSVDLYRTLRIVARYETSGCWASATGDFDGQLLSVGVMQWNFGQGTLQPLLKRFSEKFSSQEHFRQVRDELMPRYGETFFDLSCRTPRIQEKCKAFLKSKMTGSKRDLDAELKKEIDALFNNASMRQIQLDYFARSVTSVLSDLARVFETNHPAPWQVAWAVDLKTQQGNKFPTDKNIQRIRQEGETLAVDERKKRLNGVIKWYEGLCESGSSQGIKFDCPYNVKTWPTLVDRAVEEKARERTVHFTYLVSKTAQNDDGAYQGNAFQRRAAMAFGRGSVHRTVYDFVAP
jgi:hypothetical protein